MTFHGLGGDWCRRAPCPAACRAGAAPRGRFFRISRRTRPGELRTPEKRNRAHPVPAGGDTRLPAKHSSSGRPAPGHRRDRRRARPLGSWPRPPTCQRGAGLEAGNLLPQQLGLHGHLADLPLQPRDLVVAVVALVLLQRRLGGFSSGGAYQSLLLEHVFAVSPAFALRRRPSAGRALSLDFIDQLGEKRVTAV